jgi:CheY-like chemotaxis protein
MSEDNTNTLTEEEIFFLTLIINRGIKEVKPIIGNKGIQYEGLNYILNEKNYDWDKISDMLKTIVKKGIINKKEYEKFLLCPKCGSPKVYTKYSCLKCESTHITNMRIVEHPFCGFTGSLDSFRKGSDLVCPRCNNKVASSARDVNLKSKRARKSIYKIIGSTFECDKCEWKSDRPDILHSCTECGSNFSYKNSNYESIFSYEIPEKIIKELRKSKEITILIVEDNDDDAEILTRCLNKHKEFSISRVSRGEEGLKRITENIFDIILLDYGLPDMTGIDFLKKMREAGVISSVLILTGRDDRNSAVESMKLGASDYLVKSDEEYKIIASTIKQIVIK